MQLLRVTDVQVGAAKRVYRHPRVRALALWLAAFTADAAMFHSAFAGSWKVGYVFGPFLLLFLLLTLRFVTARFHASNWLVRTNQTGVYVQYRSYLNFQLPAEAPSVVFLSYGEIASARLVRERLQTPDPRWPNTTQTQFLRYVELELVGDIGPLADALEAERLTKAAMEKHVIGASSTLYRDYPVTLGTPPYLRIHWNVAPGAKRFLEHLRPYTTIADPVSVTEEFAQLQSLGRDEQQNRLRALAVRGDVIGATYLARKIYGCGLAEAKQIVDRLLEQPQR